MREHLGPHGRVAMVFGLRTHFEQMLEKVIEINRVVRHRKSASEARSEA